MAPGAPGTSGIIPRKYKSGSIIYFEGDRSEDIYILKSGRVILTSIKLDTGEEIKEEVKQGEFFGVKSSLGKYPREETAQTVGDTIVLIMSLSDFERLVLRNINVVRKMLRVFSNQLRRVGKMVRSVLGETDEINPEKELFRIGEYYYKKGVLNQAKYAFKKYIEYYPDTEYSGTARERIKSIDSGQTYSGAADTGIDSSTGIESDGEGLDDFTFDEIGISDDSPESHTVSDGGIPDFDETSGKESELSGEMDDFLSDDSESLDDFSFDEPGGDDLSEFASVIEMYNTAKDLYSSDKYADALELYQTIMKSKDIDRSDQKEAFENAHFEAGKCHLKLGNIKEALAGFGSVIKNFPDSGNVKKAVYNIGEIFEKANQKEKALSYFNKVLNILPMDEINENAMKKIKQLQA